MERGRAQALYAGVILAGAGLLACGGEFTGVDERRVITLPESLSFSAIGEEAQLLAWSLNAAGDTVPASVQWSSRDPAVAKVAAGGVVSAAGNGTTYVVGTASDGIDSVRVRVDQVAKGLVLTPHADTLRAIGDSAQLHAAAVDANGHPVADEEIGWASKHPGIAEVDGMGRILARSAGVAMITASIVCCGDSATVVVDPTDPTLETVEVTPGSAAIDQSGTQQFTAKAIDSDGNPMGGVNFTWSSQHTNVATVNSQGVATAAAPGTTTITATAGSRSGTATLTVNAVVTGTSITLDPATRHQVMSGWEAGVQSGQDLPGFDTFKDELFDRAVNELGINRMRLTVRASAENSEDYWVQFQSGQIDAATWRCVRYSTVNDNDDPNQANAAGFHWGELDHLVTSVILPMRQRLQARGEKLYVNLLNVAFTNQICSGYSYIHDDPDEYAEFVVEAFKHLDRTYGIVPDALELILEPDNHTVWTNGDMVGRAMVAAAARLKAAGYTPDFIAPSTLSMSAASTYFDQLIVVPGAAAVISSLSYHRYGGVSSTALQKIGSRTRQYGIRSAMLEHVGSGYEDLHADITIGNASAWQQFTLAFPTQDNGAQYYWIDSNYNVNMGSRTRYLRQYFRWVRMGAQRIGAASTTGTLEPLGFINTDGSYVVVVKANGGETFSVRGLPGGTYGIRYTTASEYDAALPDVTISGGQAVQASIPAVGVITIFRK